MLKQILIGLLSVSFVLAKNEQFDGHALYQVTLEQAEQKTVIHDLESTLFVDVWSHPALAHPGQILVAKDKRDQFEQTLTAAEVKYEVITENIKPQLDLEDELMSKSSAKRSNSSGPWLSYDEVHRFDVVSNYLDELANLFPHLVTVAVAGYSVEGRSIKYLKISTTNFEDESKPVVMMESLLHSREWITQAATLYSIQKLLDGSEPDMLQNIDWIILPVANPDGFEFTHNSDRMWRKNRRTGFLCHGVDLNRNFNSDWGVASSSFTCAENYHGSGANSEPETVAISSIIVENAERMSLFLDIHSFGSWILYGYGTGAMPPNALVVNWLAVSMAQTIDALKWSWKPNYVVGNVALLLYPATGGSMDFAMDQNVPFSFTFELPGHNNLQGFDGFLVNPEFIEQAGFETWAGIKVGAQNAVSMYRSIKSAK